MTISIPYQPRRFTFVQPAAYGWAIVFIAGNLLLPQLCHLVPSGGRVLLPIYFFTLIGAYWSGITVGLLTALLSPLVNNWIFQMPPAQALPVIMIKSVLLAISAAFVATRFRRLSLLHLLLVIVIYQLIGSSIEWMLTGSLQAALQDLVLGWPGMLLQLIGGYLLLRTLERNEHKDH
ncbi:MAG: hypothetical protein ABW019_08290 [Chitinophagaceae bacterium]